MTGRLVLEEAGDGRHPVAGLDGIEQELRRIQDELLPPGDVVRMPLRTLAAVTGVASPAAVFHLPHIRFSIATGMVELRRDDLDVWRRAAQRGAA